MKYSEFESRINKRLGFKVTEHITGGVAVEYSGNLVAVVSKKRKYHFQVDNLWTTDDEARYLAQMCHELACTPLDERENEKKYRLKFSAFNHLPGKYISKGLITGSYQITPLGYPHQKHDFTKEEIEAFPNKVLEHAHKCEWEVVE